MPYNRVPLAPFTAATAEQINAEFAKIEAELRSLGLIVANIEVGTGTARFTWTAYADSADGSANFTTGSPGNRAFIGQAFNRTSATPSTFPEDYVWTRLKGADGSDGADGTDGSYFENRYVRQWAPPLPATGAVPAGTSTVLPAGVERLWMTTAKKDGAGGLLSAWSVWQSLSGVMLRGVYAAAEPYFADDAATYAGGTYRARGATTGNAPSGTASGNAWWDVIAAPGGTGSPATPDAPASDTIVLTSSAAGVNLRTLANTAGYTGNGDADFTFEVPNGVTITGVGNGAAAIDTGVWPSTSYTIALTLVVKSGGIVQGGGGLGGFGASYGAAAEPGGRGGDAISCSEDLAITIDAGGIVRSGGGGGAGGAGSVSGWPEPTSYGGGGGGGGAPNGSGGDGGYGDGMITPDGPNGQAGAEGTSAGGAGGASGGGESSPGGNGGAFGQAGQNSAGVLGGQPGAAVRKNGRTVPITNNGTMIGVAA